ncbi:ankyrin [Annulohypoxylon maeteangense]|uniref:ankyrin n=1 Tax=Annulohypoxylon maeteangense TaxID=1927788 RepID=UPI0020085D9E|nr:ankyrin [Annulohypoxylon maeteangense]KAI0885887.1 ankyrin [Annulohypoxylon maeteangense]
MDVVGSVASIIQLIEVTGKVINYCAAVIGASKMIDDLGHTASTMLQFLYEVKRQVITDSTTRSPLGLEELIKDLETCMINLARQFEKLSPKGLLQRVRFVHMDKDIEKTINKAARMNGLIGSWLSLDTNQKTKTIDEGVKALNSSVEEENIRGKMDRIVHHFAPVSFSEKHSNVLQQRQDETNQWFLQSPEFQDWMQSSGSTLWCSGAPGAGKTVMASTAIEYLYEKVKGSDTSSLAYVYCDYRQRQDQKASILLGNIWAQLFLRRGPSATEVEQMFGEIFARFDFTPNRTHMINLIREELTNGDWKRVYIVVDALDECSDENERNGFIDGLHSLQPLVNVLVTSRTLHSDNGGFNDVRSIWFTPTNEDMGIYIDARIRESKKISSYVERKPELAKEIRRIVIDRANGMFLLCRMHLDSLSRSITLKDLKRELSRIPKGENVVKDTYDQAMSRIRDQGVNIEEFALRVIRWVCFARRPLKLAELLCALAVSPDDEELDEDAVGDESDIANYCAGLVVVEGDSKTVRFVHYTTQEYFNSVRESEEFAHSHGDIALTCITFLGLNDITLSKGGYVAQMWPSQEETPFLAYAALNFGYHCGREAEVLGSGESDVSSETTELLLEFLKRPEHVNRAAITILLHLGGRVSSVMQEIDLRNALFTKAVAMDVAAFFGLIRSDADRPFTVSLEWLIENTEQAGDPNENWFGNSLHWACLNDSVQSIEALLSSPSIKLDANQAIQHPIGWQPAVFAVGYGSLGALQVLLGYGVDIYAHCEHEWSTTLLEEAIRWAHAAKGSKTELIDAIMEKDTISKLLIQHDVYWSTALMEAVNTTDFSVFECIMGHYEKTQWPPGRREKVILTGNFEWKTALHLAASDSSFSVKNPDKTAISGPQRILDALLDSSYANGLLQRRDRKGDTPFEAAIRRNHIQAVDTILAKNGQHKFVDFYPSQVLSGLYLAARTCGPTMINLLLENLTPDLLNRPGENGVLHYAAGGNKPENTEFLIQKFANLQLYNIPDSKGNLPLHYAAKSGNLDAVIALLKQDGIQVDSRNQCGQTALHLATDDNLADICSRLLKAGANINIKDNKGITPLHVAIQRRFSDIVGIMATYHLSPEPGNLSADDTAWLQQQPRGNSILRRSSTTPNPNASVEYWPKQEEDIITAALCLRRKLRRQNSPLSKSCHRTHTSTYLASFILDLAEYWIRSSSTRISIDKGGEVRRWGDPVIPYLTSQAITSLSTKPVRRVEFEITGHDQGYCSNPARGESWTWFTADVHRRENSVFAQELSGPQDQGTTNHEIYLAHNRGANRTWHTHKLVWSLADPEVTDAERGTWIKGLMPGDRVVVLPHARYPGWENWVRRMRIDIYTTCLRNDLDLDWTASAATSTESLPQYELLDS